MISKVKIKFGSLFEKTGAFAEDASLNNFVAIYNFICL